MQGFLEEIGVGMRRCLALGAVEAAVSHGERACRTGTK
jgi:hypothetical protein